MTAEDPRDVGTGNDAFVCVSQYGSGKEYLQPGDLDQSWGNDDG